MTEKKIAAALISVYYKDGLLPIVQALQRQEVTIYSTGGTEAWLRENNIPVVPVEELTGYPSILGGRVKTLHPKVFGGILARPHLEQDRAEMQEFAIPGIDLVIVDLYPFEETLAQTKEEAAIIEKIDIGGISLIRAAAKNFREVLLCASRSDYDPLLALLQRSGGSTLEERRHFAARGFQISSHYDTAIFHYFNAQEQWPGFQESISGSRGLRYGENPHQQGRFYGPLEELFDQLHGKELSYNNLVDIDAAISLIHEFQEPTFAIIKHTNACGVASADNLKAAWNKALAGDPVSAFGGVLVCNGKLMPPAATLINELFFEVLIAPDFDAEALRILQSKKNRVLLRLKQYPEGTRQFKSLLNGVVEQDKDLKTETAADLKVVTTAAPDAAQINDLLFANKLEKHLKSNAIVLVKDKQLLGMGCGMTSRVDALRHAIAKAGEFHFDLNGAVMASDAFFPFADCVQIAYENGIRAVIQPGGSVRDQESVDYCNRVGLPMVTTGTRHFKH